MGDFERFGIAVEDLKAVLKNEFKPVLEAILDTLVRLFRI